MNQAQRKFLIDKIEAQVKISINALEDSKPESPNLNNYLLHQVLSGKFKLRPQEHIKNAIKQKALNAKEGENWMTGERAGWNGYGSREFKLSVRDLFEVDEEYQRMSDNYKSETNGVNEKIRVLRVQADTLITRIQLASDRVLEKMINEVDDMGDISLMDTKIKFLNS